MTLLKIGDLLCELHSEVNFRVLFKGLVPPRGNLKLLAPGSDMFIATDILQVLFAP